jgi:DNA repair exonuclease SbcCD ATPase subunit
MPGNRMKSLDIKYIYAQNFLCFGPEAFELTFKDHGNIVLVKGFNLDVVDSESRVASNGVGKSSIPEIIVYTLFGKTIKHPKKINHKDVINNQVGKSLKTEVRWGDFRVVRTRKPDTLRLWESPDGIWDDTTEITLGGQPATQKLLEEKLGLNYETFVNVVVFTDNNAGSFLECDASNKREIVENLLSLDKYKGFAERAKNLKKEKKDAIKILQNDYENIRKQLEQSKSRIKAAKEQESNWVSQRKAELESLLSKIKSFRDQLETTSEGTEVSRYQTAQLRIEELNSEIPQAEAKRLKIQEILDLAQEKSSGIKQKQNECKINIDTVAGSIKSLSAKIDENKKEIGRLEKNEGATCKFCHGTVSRENYKKYTEQLLGNIETIQSEMDSESLKKDELAEKLDALNAMLLKISEGVSSAKENLTKASKEIAEKRNELADLNKVEKPQGKDIKNQLITKQIEGLNDQVSDKRKELEGDTPFKKIIDDLAEEIETRESEFESKNKDLDELEKQLPYYEFWSVAFGDSGIRKFIIDGIIPALNSRVAYWLQFLIDGKISLEFNNELEEKIERSPSDGDPFVYYAMSGGERRRLNLAVSQAFAYVMMLSSGMCPSLVFLDEVTTNIDQIGVVGVYNMILELAKDRQVFITTHDQNLLEMLDGCELISLEKRKGFTHLKKSS